MRLIVGKVFSRYLKQQNSETLPTFGQCLVKPCNNETIEVLSDLYFF